MCLPWYFLVILIVLYGISFTLDQASFHDYGDYFGMGTLIILIIGVGVGVGPLLWLTYSALFYGLGRVFGGKGTWEKVQIAVAVSFIPYVFKFVLWCAQWGLFKEEMFTNEMPHVDSNLYTLVVYFLTVLIDLVTAVWFYILSFRVVGEAHQLSSWLGMVVVLCSVGLVWLVSKMLFNIVLLPV
ncbi:YIP1 family protein [Marininema mesophilum]|nr:YIP1 family protein [Marininema mesophilum]